MDFYDISYLEESSVLGAGDMSLYVVIKEISTHTNGSENMISGSNVYKKSLIKLQANTLKKMSLNHLEFSFSLQQLLLLIRKFLRDFYFTIFSFSNYSQVLKFASKHSYSRPFPWFEKSALFVFHAKDK